MCNEMKYIILFFNSLRSTANNCIYFCIQKKSTRVFQSITLYKSISFTNIKRSALDNLINSEILYFKMSDNERITEASIEENDCGMSRHILTRSLQNKIN